MTKEGSKKTTKYLLKETRSIREAAKTAREAAKTARAKERQVRLEEDFPSVKEQEKDREARILTDLTTLAKAKLEKAQSASKAAEEDLEKKRSQLEEIPSSSAEEIKYAEKEFEIAKAWYDYQLDLEGEALLNNQLAEDPNNNKINDSKKEAHTKATNSRSRWHTLKSEKVVEDLKSLLVQMGANDPSAQKDTTVQEKSQKEEEPSSELVSRLNEQREELKSVLKQIEEGLIKDAEEEELLHAASISLPTDEVNENSLEEELLHAASISLPTDEVNENSFATDIAGEKSLQSQGKEVSSDFEGAEKEPSPAQEGAKKEPSPAQEGAKKEPSPAQEEGATEGTLQADPQQFTTIISPRSEEAKTELPLVPESAAMVESSQESQENLQQSALIMPSVFDSEEGKEGLRLGENAALGESSQKKPQQFSSAPPPARLSLSEIEAQQRSAAITAKIMAQLTAPGGPIERAFNEWKAKPLEILRFLTGETTNVILKEICDPNAPLPPIGAVPNMVIEILVNKDKDIEGQFIDAFKEAIKHEQDTKDKRRRYKMTAAVCTTVAVCVVGGVIIMGGYGAFVVPFAARTLGSLFGEVRFMRQWHEGPFGIAKYSTYYSSRRGILVTDVTRNIGASLLAIFRVTIGFDRAVRLLTVGALSGVSAVTAAFGYQALENEKRAILNKPTEAFAQSLQTEMTKFLQSSDKYFVQTTSLCPDTEMRMEILELFASNQDPNALASLIINKMRSNQDILEAYTAIAESELDKDKRTQLASILTLKLAECPRFWPDVPSSALKKSWQCPKKSCGNRCEWHC